MEAPTRAEVWNTRGSKPEPPQLIAIAAGFGAGVLAFHLQVDPLPLAATALVALAVLWGARRCRLLWPAFWVALGMLYAQLHANDLLEHRFTDELSRVDLVVTGVIVSLPTDRGVAERFRLRVESAQRAGQPIDFAGLVRLSWYDEVPALTVGERWRLRVRLVPPHGFANPGGFDYERWLFVEGIKATGYVRDDPINQRLSAGTAWHLVGRWRQRLRARLGEQLADAEAGGLIQALVLGERGGLTPDQWETLTRTGTNHLVAISGLHIGLIAGFAFHVGRWLWSRSARLSLGVAAPRAGAVTAALAAFGYSALAGFALPTQRALIMVGVVLAALLWGRTLRPFHALALALLGVLLLDPRAVLSFGLWLSFGAVALLLFALGQRPAVGGVWRRWGQAQWVVALGLLPLVLPFFGRASLVAPLVNLIAVPVVALLLPLLLIAALLSLLPGLGLPLTLVAGLLDWAYGLLEGLAGNPWAATAIGSRPTWVWLTAAVGIILCLAPRGLPGRRLGAIWLLPLLLVHPPAPPRGQAWLTLLDVGQGLAAVVRTHRHTLVFDTGPGFPSGFNTGSAVVLPYLRHQGVATIDTLVVSHADNDHAGGLAGLIGTVPIGRILSGEPAAIAANRAEPCRAGQGWRWDGVAFTLLHPDGPAYTGNDSSCVLRVTAGRDSLLLTGDIGRRVEQRLVERLGPQLSSDLLIASHHGSNSSSSKAFLAAVTPDYVLYATGFANRYGFPAPAVRARVAAMDAHQIDTSRAGAIRFELGGAAGVGRPWLQRRHAPRLWTHRPALRPTAGTMVVDDPGI